MTADEISKRELRKTCISQQVTHDSSRAVFDKRSGHIADTRNEEVFLSE